MDEMDYKLYGLDSQLLNIQASKLLYKYIEKDGKPEFTLDELVSKDHSLFKVLNYHPFFIYHIAKEFKIKKIEELDNLNGLFKSKKFLQFQYFYEFSKKCKKLVQTIDRLKEKNKNLIKQNPIQPQYSKTYDEIVKHLKNEEKHDFLNDYFDIISESAKEFKCSDEVKNEFMPTIRKLYSFVEDIQIKLKGADEETMK